MIFLPAHRIVILSCVAILTLGCVESSESQEPDQSQASGESHSPALDPEFVATSEAWRAARLASLQHPDGYLSLLGLHWLEGKPASFGSASDTDLRLPAGAPAVIGRFEPVTEGVVMQVSDGVLVTVDGQPVTRVLMQDDLSGQPVTAALGSLRWSVINRDGRRAVRLRDTAHPAIEAFPGLEYFPLDPGYVVPARLKRYPEPRVVNVDTVIEGLGYRPTAPGVLEFELEDQSVSLEAYDSGDELFIVFGDKTSGRETYPAGRFLYTRQPQGNETVWLDFNRAYNPPCAFNDFATCPVASLRNRLPVRVEAGELYSKALHAGQPKPD